jgi:hypothetical protein
VALILIYFSPWATYNCRFISPFILKKISKLSLSGEIRLKKQIEILSLRGIENYSPFQLDDEIEEFLIHRSYLAKLEKELPKPLRRQDRKLDYLPTQYLSEYIKYLGYDGIEYGSSLNSTGYNLAIFDNDCADCISTKIYEIVSLDYIYNEV